MKKFKFLIQSLFILAYSISSSQNIRAQDSINFKFIDTCFVKGYYVGVYRPKTDWNISAIIKNKKDADEVAKLYLSHVSYEELPLFVAEQLGVREYIVLKSFIQDSLLSRFSSKTICQAIQERIHPDSSVFLDVSEIPDIQRCFGSFYFRGKQSWEMLDSFYPANKSKKIKIKKIIEVDKSYIPNRKEEILLNYYTVPFQGWGMIIELNKNCDFFFSSSTEYWMLIIKKYPKIRVFIPLEKR